MFICSTCKCELRAGDVLDHASTACSKPADIRIVILQRGWVMVGNYARDREYVTLENPAVIRRWGTERGLGQVADGGPTVNTILDRATRPFEAHVLTTIGSQPCDPEKWFEPLGIRRT